MFVYGRNAVREAVRGPRTVKRLWATKNAAREEWLAPSSIAALTGSSIAVAQLAAAEIEEICGSVEHQGVCAEVSSFQYADPESLIRALDRPLVVLDQVQDPQNLGAICRSAECAGAAGVVLPERRAAEVTAAVCKASAGAVEHLPVARVRNLADFLGEVKAAGRWCYGADAGARLSFDSIDYSDPLVLVLGSEGRGLRPRVAASCDELVSIPLRGRIGSLSVSAAAAVLLYAATGRPQAPTGRPQAAPPRAQAPTRRP